MSTAKMVLVVLFLLVALASWAAWITKMRSAWNAPTSKMEYGFCACVFRLTLPVNAALRSLSEPLRFWWPSPRLPMSGCPHRRFSAV
jgi:hypothetical protein